MPSRLIRFMGALVLVFVFGVVACEATFPKAKAQPVQFLPSLVGSTS